jgi:hypothetical protein
LEWVVTDKLHSVSNGGGKKLSSLGLVRGKEKGTLEHRKERGGGGGRRRLVWLGYDGMGRQQSTSCDRVGEEREKREKEGERLNS